MATGKGLTLLTRKGTLDACHGEMLFIDESSGAAGGELT
jgi:hypothetical protein